MKYLKKIAIILLTFAFIALCGWFITPPTQSGAETTKTANKADTIQTIK